MTEPRAGVATFLRFELRYRLRQPAASVVGLGAFILHELSLEVSGTPVTAGIDPRVLFIDRDPDDNVHGVALME